MSRCSFTSETVYAPHDPDDGSSEGVLAVIYRPGELGERVRGASFVTDPTLPLQVAFIGHETGDQVEPHTHPPAKRETRGTPEVLMIAEGTYHLHLYTSRGRSVGLYSLHEGDLVLLVSGGHGLVALERGSIMEVKMGPYLGADDKVKIREEYM